MWIRLCALFILCPIGGAWSYYEGNYRRAPRRQALSHSYPRDWDTDWPRTQAHAQRRARRREDWELGDPVPEYHYSYHGDSPLRPRLTVVPPTPPAVRQETRGVWLSQQRGSVAIPYRGASVRVGPQHATSKFYRGMVTTTVSDGVPPRRRGNRSHRHRNRGSTRVQSRQQSVDTEQQYSQDQPPPVHTKVCAPCPSDRAVLAKKGSTRVQSRQQTVDTQQQYSQDQPPPIHTKVCARCPSDRAVLAKKGSTRVQSRQQSVDTEQQYSQDQPPPVHTKVCARCPSDRAVLAKKGSTRVQSRQQSVDTEQQYSQDQPPPVHTKVCARCPSDRAVLAKKGSTRVQSRQQSVDTQQQYSQDQPPPVHTKVCARCPSDRAVLAKKGSTTVLMETPPVIPCHTWSSVERVKQEVVAGPQPGEHVPEGSHKIVIRLYRHRRTLDTCVTRYNVIVRKCPALEVGPGVKAACSLGKAWGSRCNMTCDPGYELEGDVATECSDDLEWSGVMPLCVATTSCPRPVSPENGHLSCRTPRHQPIKAKDMLPDGSVCHYLCDAGYTIPPAQQHLTKVRCVAGSWDSDTDPICLETNELEEEEPPPEITAEDAIRFDEKECPENYCHNGGKCLMILDDPMCSCKSGYSGSQCEDPDEPDLDPDESNTIDDESNILDELNKITESDTTT